MSGETSKRVPYWQRPAYSSAVRDGDYYGPEVGSGPYDADDERWDEPF